MVNSTEVRKVTQDVLLFVWYNRTALYPEPPRESDLIPKISNRLMHDLSASVLIESFRTLFIWDDFFKNNFEVMTSSTELFAKYVAYTFYILNMSANAYECFFDILSIVSEFSLRCLQGDLEKYLNTCVDLFCTFFEKELYQNFVDQGGWKEFSEYIRIHYKSVQSKFKRIHPEKPAVFVFKYFPEALAKGNRLPYLNAIGVPKKKKKPYYVVNGIVLKDITRKQVETHEKAVCFAKSIQYKLETLVEKNFQELIIEFEKTYNQLRNEKEQFRVALSKRRRRRQKQDSLQEFKPSPSGTKPEVELKQKVQKSSDGRKNQAGQCSSSKNGKHPDGMRDKLETQKKSQYSDVKNIQVELGSSSKGQEPPDDMRGIRDLPKKGQSSDGMKNQAGQCSSSKAGKHPDGMRGKEEPQEKSQYSDGIKNPAVQGISNKDKCPDRVQSKVALEKSDKVSSDRMQNKVTTLKKDQQSFDGIKKQVEQCTFSNDKKSPDGVQSEVAIGKNDKVSFDGMKSENQWNLVLPRSKKRQEKQCSSQNVQHCPVGMQSKVGPGGKDKKSSDGMKDQAGQCSSSKNGKHPDGMRGKVDLPKKGKSSDGRKNQEEKGFSSKNEKHPDGMRGKGDPQKKSQYSDGMKNQKQQNPSSKGRKPDWMPSKGDIHGNGQSSDGIKDKVEQQCISNKDQKCPDRVQSKVALEKSYKVSSDGMKNKVTTLEKDQQSFDGIKNQVELCIFSNDEKSPDWVQNKVEIDRPDKKCSSQNVKHCPVEMQIEVEPGEKDKKTSDGIKNQVKQSSSREDRKPSGQVQGKEAQCKKYQEFSDEMKNQAKQYSLNDKEASEIISCKIEVTKTELKSKTAKDLVSLKTQNLDTTNLQNCVTPVQASNLKLKSIKIKKLLGNISSTFANFSELIHSECEKHGVQVPEELRLKK